MMIRLSSLYSPISVLLIMFDSWERIRAPTNSHTFVPSKLPMVTSNRWLLSFFYPWFAVTEEERFAAVLEDPDIKS